MVPLDGSKTAETALPAARALARYWQAELILVRVRDFTVPSPLGSVPGQALRFYSSQVRPYIERCACDLIEEGFTVRVKLPTGRPGPSLLRLARRERADVIVMCSHGHTGPARWLLGSVTDEVLRRASCPVLVVRPGGAPLPEDGFHRALVPVDGSDISYGVVGDVGRFLAAKGGLEVFWATNLTPLDLAYEERQDCVRALEAELVERFPDHPHRVVDGDAAACILDEAQAAGHDLIAMATHGRSGFRRFLLGSVTERVARHASCPVLVFPPTAAAAAADADDAMCA